MAWGSSAALGIVLQHPWGFGANSPILFASISRAPRIISNLQGRCGHEKATEEAAEQENLISTIDEIV
jgi:hypothetical protein